MSASSFSITLLCSFAYFLLCMIRLVVCKPIASNDAVAIIVRSFTSNYHGVSVSPLRGRIVVLR